MNTNRRTTGRTHSRSFGVSKDTMHQLLKGEEYDKAIEPDDMRGLRERTSRIILSGMSIVAQQKKGQ